MTRSLSLYQNPLRWFTRRSCLQNAIQITTEQMQHLLWCIWGEVMILEYLGLYRIFRGFSMGWIFHGFSRERVRWWERPGQVREGQVWKNAETGIKAPILFKLVVDQYTELPEPCTACPIFLLTFISVFISVWIHSLFCVCMCGEEFRWGEPLWNMKHKFQKHIQDFFGIGILGLCQNHIRDHSNIFIM